MKSCPFFVSVAVLSGVALLAVGPGFSEEEKNEGAGVSSGELPFERQEIDAAIRVGYGLAVADVNGDGKPDVMLADADAVVWYENPTWRKHRIAGKLTEKDHVAIAARNFPGLDAPKVATGAGWNPGDTVGSGAVFGLNPEDGEVTTTWKVTPQDHEPTVHRMLWMIDGKESPFLAVLPLHGRGNKDGEGAGVKFLGYRSIDGAEKWGTSSLLPEGLELHQTHNFDVVDWPGASGEVALVAGKEGVHRIDLSDETPVDHAMTKESASEVRLGRGADGKRFLATIEPFHGNKVVVYRESEGDDGPWDEGREVLDETLNQGHALAAADFLGLGEDQIIAGWREADADGKVGIRLYQRGTDGKFVRGGMIDDGGMACEDMKIADLDGDGRLDIVAAGRSTRNVVIYWNKSEIGDRDE